MFTFLIGASFILMVQSEPRCDQTEFLHHNGSCVACPVCKPGQQLSGDCGFGYGGDGVCIPCEAGTFSTDAGVDPCRRCTQCNLLNRLALTACSPTSDTVCGHCLPGHYELKSLTGEVELLCIPCDSRDTFHKECLHFTSRGSKTQQIPECRRKPEGLLSAADLQDECPSGHAERATQQDRPSEPVSPEDTPRGPNSLNHESEMHPTSIVINVTTNIKPCSQKQDNIMQEAQKGFTTEEVEQKLQTIWEIAQGQSIEMLSYDTIQDLSLLLDSPNHIYVLRKLGLSLGVPPHLTPHFHSFQDLFQYLRTSTYTQLPQLAQAAALLPNFEVVSRIHKALVNK
ncbi:uncharacterized protein LOC129360603 [Poeciliopsis prolifica]|uniref:uncharacterized protein LOC129360603 n=1 Tax=Poeciliopsis prolifica TaxID=188132 RepID=UPI0024139CDE|nr:uncharacterized protein LOC129360603 [Poeciliopsis prolifica]